MNKRVYRTASGKPVDMDALRMANETYIAVGNMRVNARGDELGPGGKIVRTREEIQAERKREMDAQPKAQSNPTVPQNSPRKATADNAQVQKAVQAPVVPIEFPEDVDDQEPLSPEELKAMQEQEQKNIQKQNYMRGSLAYSVAGQKTVTQELEKDPRKPDGPQRLK